MAKTPKFENFWCTRNTQLVEEDNYKILFIHRPTSRQSLRCFFMFVCLSVCLSVLKCICFMSNLIFNRKNALIDELRSKLSLVALLSVTYCLFYARGYVYMRPMNVTGDVGA